MGKYGRIQLSKKGETLLLKNKRESDNSSISYLRESINAIRSLREKYFNRSDDSELSNIFDENNSDNSPLQSDIDLDSHINMLGSESDSSTNSFSGSNAKIKKLSYKEIKSSFLSDIQTSCHNQNNLLRW